MRTVIDRILNRTLVLALMFALASPWAFANPGSERFYARQENRHNGAQRQPQPNYPQREMQRQESQRYERGEAQRPQRLSPEERRQLRRDIQDAGREIYPRRR